MRTIHVTLASLLATTVVASAQPTTPPNPTTPTGPSQPAPTGPANPVPSPQPLPGPYDPVSPTGPLAPPTTPIPADEPIPTTTPGDTTEIPDTTGRDPNTPIDPEVPTSQYPDPTPTNMPTSAPDPYANTVLEERYVGPSYGSLTDVGIAISAGAGVSGFTNDALRGTSADGGGWDVRVSVGTRRTLAFEASYIGSAQQLDALGLDDDAVLVGNGAQGNVRLNLVRGMAVQPFVFGGAAFRRYDVTNSARNLSDVSDSDTVLEVPMGVGVGARAGGVLLEARGEYRAAFDDDLVGADAPMNRYGATLNVGYEF